MIELLKHIETLLLENDCVIIPSFGGFVSHYTSARWLEEEGIFLPPTRSIGFNPQLKMNDGLLVQSYMTSYCTDFSDASKLIHKAVEELINTLHDDGKIEMHGIGDMFFTIHGKLQFQPYEDGLLTPYLYGLSSFNIDKVGQKSVAEEKREVETSDSKVYEIKVNRSFLRTAVAVAAAIIIFFFMSTPVENTYIEKNNYAQLIPSELLEPFGNNSSNEVAPIKKDISSGSESTIAFKKGEQIKPKAVKEILIPKKNIEKNNIPVKTVTESLKKNSCHIIIASVNNRAEAQEIVSRLKSKGYSEASFIEGSKRIRVSIMSFSNNEEASNKLFQLKKNANYKDAWLLAD